jgi:mycothiol synthase
VNVQVLDHLDPGRQAALDALVTRCEEVDQHPVLSEDLRDPSGRIDLDSHGARAVLLGPDAGNQGEGTGDLYGCATLTPGVDGTTALHVAVDPRYRSPARGGGEAGDIRGILIETAMDRVAGPVRLWIMEVEDGDDAAVDEFGFRPERDLLQMLVGLPLPDDVVAATRPVETRSFDPGRDDEAWLSVNNRAFAGHPEQGNWTVERLREREASEWFDPAGFLVAPDPAGGGSGLLGSCWTKIHRHHTPPLGEIYVISVDPSRHSEGWGRALTVAGLQWLTGQGLSDGMLYTDAGNAAAVALYRSLGFTVDHVDRSYLGSGRAVS